MSFTLEATIACDKCGDDEVLTMPKDQTLEDAVDDEGWFWTGTLLDRLLCGDCYEEEEG